MITIGIDIGGSTTKIVGFPKEDPHKLIEPFLVRATDPITAVYGAFGRFLSQNGLSLSDIERIAVTGVGSRYITEPLYGLPCDIVPEFRSIGLGALYLSGLSDCIAVSLGTGTALVHAVRGGEIEYLGGTGVGGGTLSGISKKLLDISHVEHIAALAAEGNLDNIDLKIKDITADNFSLPPEMTASNFGKVSELASREDLALGLINMVFETAFMMGVFTSRMCKTKDIVLTGNLTQIPQAKKIFGDLAKMFDVRVTIPDRAQYATVIGAALCAG